MQEHVPLIFLPIEFYGYDLSVTLPILISGVVSLLIFFFLLLANAFRRFRQVEHFLFDFISESFASSLKTKNKIWFSFLITLFLFVFLNNLSGLIPGSESPTGNINFTAAMAILGFLISQISGALSHGFHHIQNLVPSGIPKPMLIFFVPLEIVSQLARPFSLAVRLFANMMAGHKVLTIFLALTVAASPFIKLLPFGGVVLVSLFEMFVAFIQAFIFTYLASFYISDAVNGAH